MSELRDDLKASFTEAAAEPVAAVETPAPAVEAAEPAPAPAAGPVRDESGRFAAKEPNGVVTPAPLGAPPPAANPTPPAAAAVPVPKPPQSWKAAEREEWEKIPAGAQQAILRREREAELSLRKAADAGKITDVLAPYEQALRAEGRDPRQHVESLLRTERALASGSIPQRAQVAAGLLKSYGLTTDEALKAVAAALDGQPAQAASPPIDPEAIERRVMARIEQQQQQSQLSNQVRDFIATEPEFLGDVQAAMVGLYKQGVAKTLPEAYEKACWADPEVRKILQQREASKQAATGAQATQRAQRAASSVKPTPGGSLIPSPEAGESIRDDIRAVMAANRR
jgi:hypothetical protein